MIGVFDSGLGGLTALWELRRLRPDLDVVYFGDTAHVPYGTRSPEMIRRFAEEAIDFLSGLGAEAILVACGTVSSVVLPDLRARTVCPVFGVVEPAAQAAYRASRSKHIGILATEATVRSRAFEEALRAIGPVATRSVACPLFVSLAENGFTAPDDPVARAAAEYYLAPLRGSDLDTLILGCTHFPLLAAHIHRVLPHVRLIGAGEEAAAALVGTLPRVGHGELTVYASDAPDRFEATAARILGTALPVHVQKYTPRRMRIPADRYTDTIRKRN